MKVCMNVPGYVQDAQHEYISLLNHQDLKEVYIMTPYFSDDRIARALVLAAERLRARLNRSRSRIGTHRHYAPSIDSSSTNIEDSKKIHVIFPKKQENLIIEEVSKYYAYYLRNNPVVETRQFYFEDKDNALKYEMLHAKQMVVVLENEKRNWTKYVKFGGSYNPAGRAHNMWEMNVRSINGSWDVSDEGPDAPAQNPIRLFMKLSQIIWV